MFDLLNALGVGRGTCSNTRTRSSYSGFEVNERFEGIVGEGDDIKCLSDVFGFTPIQLLAAAAKELKAIDLQKKKAGDDDIDTLRKLRNMYAVIQATAEVLLRNGARVNISSPPSTRLDRESPPGCYSLNDASGVLSSKSMPPVDREGLKIEGNDEVLTLFGGLDKIKASQKVYSSAPKVNAVGSLRILKNISSVVDSASPGGSDANSCALCWSEFGVISNRKQFCQVSYRYVCNDCSTKRLVDDGKDYRVSDGQFNAGRFEETKAIAIASATNIHSKQTGASQKKGRSRVAHARETLGLTWLRGEYSEKTEPNTNEKVSGAISSLSHTRNAVLERGDKLQGLADKSEALNQASLEFANMAKELNRQQNSFW